MPSPAASYTTGSAAIPGPAASLGHPSNDPCVGLELHACAQTRGCILEQPTYAKPMCRAAENDCEAAVRHADLIGHDADPAVTAEMTKAAQATCNALAACVATSGACSCPCSFLGTCDCDCGGGFLARCTLKLVAPMFAGHPPIEEGRGVLGELGRALVAVRRTPADAAFEMSPIPRVDSLVGERRNVIEGTLGTPWPCADTSVAPCKRRNQAFYSLYRLKRGSVGGGPELLLDYDETGKCTSAVVAHTQ